MSWRELTTETPTHVKGVTLRITKRGYDHPKLVIRIARDIAGEAALPVDSKARVKVFIGEGGDAGKMRLTSHEQGHYTAYPVGKAGALKIAVPPPIGAPGAEYPTTAAEYTVSKGGLNFALPWHKRAADREVPELVLTQDEVLAQTEGTGPVIATPNLGFVPTTLDEIEEDARPTPQLARDLADIAAKAEEEPNWLNRPASVPQPQPRHHVYADTPSGEAMKTFAHNGKSCRLNERHYAIAEKLYRAMGKGFIDDAQLMKAGRCADLAILQAAISVVRKAVAPMGLTIERVLKMGYAMKEG